MKLTAISTIEDVKNFVQILMEEENLNFHPDTPFGNYINIDSEEPRYSEAEVTLRDTLLHEAFELGDKLNIDTHEMMCQEGNRILTKILELA
jgi:hypothetical protein